VRGLVIEGLFRQRGFASWREAGRWCALAVTIVGLWLIAGISLVAPAHGLSIEITGGGADRLDRQRAWAEGELPLAGTPDLSKLSERMSAAGIKEGSAVFLRIFKSESELEVWIQKGRDFVLFATYPICQWSGVLGPKFFEGDNQSPEGFYTVGRRDLKWQTRHHRAFNIGFPNSFDKQHGRTGSNILVHGGCSTEGCFAMTNPVIDEVFRLANSAISSGQKEIQVHVFPFRMTPANVMQYSASPWLDFWINMKTGYDLFAETRQPPAIGVCKGRYAYDRVPEFGPIRPERDCEATGDGTGSLSGAPANAPADGSGSVVTTGSLRATSAAPSGVLKANTVSHAAPLAATERGTSRRVARTRGRAGVQQATTAGSGTDPSVPPLQAVPPQQLGN
jgi:murein L,D-transpeptidase YafK